MAPTETPGWPPERRAAQAARIRAQKPWLQATGPKTDAGKAVSRNNARKHGLRDAETARLRDLLALHRCFLALVRAGGPSSSAPPATMD